MDVAEHQLEDPQESSTVVERCLEDLLDDITNPDPWDLLQLMNQQQSARARPAESPLQPCIDIAAEMMDCTSGKDPPPIVGLVESEEEGAFILQPTVLKQHKSGYCGHHAFHNALCCLEMCRQKDRLAVCSLTGKLKDGVCYWRRYWKSIGLLLHRSRVENNWWPWNEGDVISGLMERSYLAHLLQTDLHAVTLGGDLNVVTLQVQMYMSIPAICLFCTFCGFIFC